MRFAFKRRAISHLPTFGSSRGTLRRVDAEEANAPRFVLSSKRSYRLEHPKEVNVAVRRGRGKQFQPATPDRSGLWASYSESIKLKIIGTADGVL